MFKPNLRFVEQMQHDPGVQRALQDKADDALGVAQARARSEGWDDEYLNSLDASDASLSTSSPTGHLREWGSLNNPPDAPLRTAVEQVGARYVDDRA